jgi:hypothetical protein
MDIFLKILGYLSIPMMLFSAYAMTKSLKKDQRVTPRSLVIQLGISIIVLIVYTLLLNVNPPTALSFSLMAVGGVFGVVWSRTTNLTIRDGVVYGKRTVWYMVAWILSITLTQTMAMTAPKELVAYGLSTIYFTTGIAIGTNLSVLIRQQRLLAVKVRSQVVCPHCNNTVSPSATFCTHCGNRLNLTEGEK